MQLAARMSASTVHLQPMRASSMGRSLVCRVSPCDSRGVKGSRMGLWGEDLAPADRMMDVVPSRSAAYWLAPALSLGISSYAVHKAGLSDTLQFFIPIAIGVFTSWAATLADKESAAADQELREFANRTLQVDVQEQDENGTFTSIASFTSPTYDEILQHTSDNRALLKPFLMQCSDVLRNQDPDEVEVLVVGPRGGPARYVGESGLDGLLNVITEVVVRVRGVE